MGSRADAQAVLGVLIKNYTFELRDGPETKIEYCRGVLPRPRVAGETRMNGDILDVVSRLHMAMKKEEGA